jgi:hypothetical protein
MVRHIAAIYSAGSYQLSAQPPCFVRIALISPSGSRKCGKALQYRRTMNGKDDKLVATVERKFAALLASDT